MKLRGQTTDKRLARWRDGACPIHGRGFVDDKDADVGNSEWTSVRCSVIECDVRAARWPGIDEHHASFGWRSGPAEVHAILVHAHDIAPEGPKPGTGARIVRTGYRLEE